MSFQIQEENLVTVKAVRSSIGRSVQNIWVRIGFDGIFHLRRLAIGIMILSLLSTTVSAGADERSVKRNPASESAGTEQRVALLIGNADYSGKDRLDNPVNDVEDYGKALKDAGFTVDVRKNLNRQELFSAVEGFGQRIRDKEGIALLHYAGHGVSVDGNNYVVPVGAETGQGDARMANDSLAVDSLLRLLGSKTDRVNVVILDMCRNIPSRGLRGDGGGLASMNRVGGTLLAFSTGFGKTARDGAGQRNSPYARQLIAALGQKNLTVTDYFAVVRGGVLQETRNEQIPEELSLLLGRAPVLVAVEDEPDPVPAMKPRVEARQPEMTVAYDTETVLWKAVESRGRKEGFEAYLKQYPKGKYMAKAKECIQNLGPSKAVYITDWKNRTDKLGIDKELYQALVDCFQRSGSISVSKDKDGADLILAGEIVSVQFPSPAYASNVPAQGKINLTIRYILKDLKGGKIILEEPNQILSEDYLTSSVSSETLNNEKKAIDNAIERIAHEVYRMSLTEILKL